MKKIKVIDLLNKIANGGELPKKIKYIGYIFEYDTNHERYESYIEEEIYTLGEYVSINDSLNDNVEIIEEKKLPEKLDVLVEIMSSDKISALTNYIREIQIRFNQLIDYLESKEKGE